MTVFRALTRGLVRMTGSTGLVVTIWMTVLLSALPLAVMMEDSIRTDIGSSGMHSSLREGLDLGWLEEFHFRGRALAGSLKPVRVTPAMVFENLDLWLSGEWVRDDRGLAVAGGMFLGIWILLQGGLLVHLMESDTSFRLAEFLAAGGTYFWRFLRLAAMTGVAYYGVYKLAFWIFPAIDRWTMDVTVEKSVLGLHVLAAGVVILLMWIVHLIADFAKIATVAEGRRSMVLAVVTTIRRLLAHPVQALGLMGLVTAMVGLTQVVYYWLAPGIQGASPLALVTTFFVGQVYLIFRWGLRVARYAAEIELHHRWIDSAPDHDLPDDSRTTNSK